jgi:hypothetical protein
MRSTAGIAKGELEAFRVEGRGFRFVDAEQIRALSLALEGLTEWGFPTPGIEPLGEIEENKDG